MKKIAKKALIALFFAVITSSVQAVDHEKIHLIPEPVRLEEQTGTFVLDAGVFVDVNANDDQLKESVQWFADKIQQVTGVSVNQKKGSKKIVFSLNKTADTQLGNEGYHLNVGQNEISLSANTAAGAFYGMQTILQLLPAKANSSTDSWTIPAVDITDYPRFGWRGLMLDVSRHFFTKEEVKHFIDEMVNYKFNTFHWHLTDDQGWRIEIKSLPELTKKGAYRVNRTGRWGTFQPALANEESTYGGYYTQEDIKEIVQYASDRYITILPEIDIPGHSLSLISTYPSLSSTKKQYPVNGGWRNTPQDDNALDPSNEEVYAKLDTIFTEVAQLFPNPYIHIGGDEAYKGYWERNPNCKKFMAENKLKNVEELQSYFIKRLVKILASKGKKLIGWDEILEGGLAPEATVMSWRGMNGGIEAAKMNHHVVMTPWDYVYLDLYQGDPMVEPDTYGMCRLSDSYNYEPVPNGIDEQLILGGQGNIWTESIPTYRHLEYMVWPRAIALSEVYWSPKAKKNWPDFFGRLEQEFVRLDAQDISYAKSCYDVIFKPETIRGLGLFLTMATEAPGLDIYYTFDQTIPDHHSAKYDGSSITFPVGATQINAITYRNGKPIGRQINIKKEELTKRSQAARHVY